MNNPFLLSDDQLKMLISFYSAWCEKNEKEKEFPDYFREKAKELKITLLNEVFLKNTSDEDLAQSIFSYSRTLEGPAHIRLGIQRISGQLESLKRNLLYLTGSSDDPFIKSHKILEGEFKIPIFAKAFWTPLFQAQYPDKLPNWNNKTENFFKKVGINIKTSKITTEEKYRLLSKAFSFMHQLDPTKDFYDLNHLMHYGTVIEEGANLIDKLIKPSTSYWQIAPGENAKFWNELKDLSIAAVGFKKIAKDLGGISEPKFKTLFQKYYPDSSTIKCTQLWNFINLKPGDKFITNKGKNLLLGAGEVKSGYKYRPEREEYKHTIDVEYYRLSEDGIPISDKFKGKFGKTITKLKREDFDELESMLDSVVKPTNSQNYWWLSANPKIWNPSDFKIGQKQTYTSKNTKGNKRRIYKNFLDVKPGDLIIGYVASPIKEVTSLIKVTKELHVTPEGEGFEFEIQDQFKVPLLLKEVQAIPDLKQSEPLRNNNQGSLFKLTKEEFDTIQEIIAEKSDDEETNEVKPYSLEDELKTIFISSEKFQSILNLISYKKNIILQGPPGVGKTFIARHIAYAMMGEKDGSRISLIQFHQSYSYEDFMQGFRPNDEGKFDLVNGIFYEFCRKAQRNPSDSHIFIIDEINRGNLSKIFGEMLMLIEADKRGPEFSIPLTYAQALDDKFFIPENIFIIGTMNTADRSLAMVDYALRRRFSFINLVPKFSSPKFIKYLEQFNVNNELITKIIDRMTKLNEKIAEDTKNLGRGYKIGHSYFCPTVSTDNYDEEWYRTVITTEIEPLVQEYWFDDPQKAQNHIDFLMS